MTPHHEPDFQTMYLKLISDKIDNLTTLQAQQAERIAELSRAVASIQSRHKVIASLVGFLAGLVPSVVTFILRHKQ